MGLRLRFLSWWTPEWFKKRGLEELANSTISGLENMLITETSTPYTRIYKKIMLKGSLAEKRNNMTEIHNELVETLINTMGHDKAIKKGREVMFKEGFSLGQKFKGTLGVGNSLDDLIRAAKILYKVLGIEFSIEQTEKDEMVMIVNHCSLSEYYTSETCQVLSAADEGVVQGLNHCIKMRFTKSITEGAPCCLASLQLEEDNK
jgi:hypothetical protein